MADNTVTSFGDLLYELRAPMQKNFRKSYPLMAEIERRSPRELMTGNQVRVPIVLNPMQGGGNPGETGTVNAPIVFNTARATVTVMDVVQPFSMTIDLDEQSVDNAAAQAFALGTTEARNALAEIINDQFNAQGALLAQPTSGAGSPGLTMTLTTAANFDRLYPGRVVDILTRASGANPGNGLRRKILSFVEASFTVTFDTLIAAADGNSGNITWTANEGIYIAGTFTAAANNALASLADVAATSGTFQNLNKATVAGWQGVDGRGGDVTTKAMSDEILDGAFRRARRNSDFAWEFGVGDPAVVDLWKQGKYAQVRYDPQNQTLKSGFSGVVYDGEDKPIPLLKDYRSDLGVFRIIAPSDLKVYGKGGGPDWVDDDGAVGRRFSRTLPKEFWLRDKLQLVALRCNRTIQLANLQRAA